MNVSAAYITTLINQACTHRGDSTAVEIKAAYYSLPSQLPETICAFANMPAGGIIILGVSELENFRITGVDDPASMEAGIVSQAQNSVLPSPAVDTYTFTLEGKDVVVAYVHSLNITDKPATYRGKPFLRQADGDYEMPLSEQKMIEQAKLITSPDQATELAAVRDTSIEDAEAESTRQLLVALRSSIQPLKHVEDDRQVLRMLGLCTSSGELTRAGLYALGTFPQGQLPSLSITAAVRLPKDSTHARTKNLETFYGPLPQLLDQSLRWVRHNLDAYQQYQDDGHMKTIHEIPLIAIREVLANALIHRDLGPQTLDMGKAINVRIEPDKLIITSPGGLKALTVRQLESEEFTRVEVNQHLYRVARSLRDEYGNQITEGEGGGLHTVFHECEKAGIRKPLIIDTGVKLTVVFFRGQRDDPAPTTSPTEHALTQAFGSHGKSTIKPNIDIAELGKNAPIVFHAAIDLQSEFTVADVANLSNLSESQVRYALRSLVGNGLLTRTGGQGRSNTTYSLA